MLNVNSINASFSFNKKFQRVVQFELNEISRSAIDHLIAKDKLPHFSTINQDWFYTTTSSESQYQHLEPWIQWTTAHTGKSFDEHQIFHLSDAAQLKHPQIWETLSEYEIESCIVGSMNAIRGDAKKGFFFPDPWSKDGLTYPVHMQPLWDLISKKVQSHATGDIRLTDLIKGLQVCFGFKLPLSLYRKIAMQLLSQKINPLNKWKMAAMFDVFLAEIFNHLLKSSNYGYYTLFLNAIAHYQHHYWRHFQRDLFNTLIKTPDCASTHDPITYGYEIYDSILAKALQLAADPDTLVIIASGLSQEPFVAKEQEGGMNYYRLYQHQALIEQLGLNHCRALPLMSRDWQVDAVDQTTLSAAMTALSQLTVNGQPLFHIHQNTSHSLFVETAITQAVPTDAVIQHEQRHIVGKFHEYFCCTAVKSGHHIGTGSLWLSQKPQNVGPELPLTDLYQLTLAAFSV